MAPRVAGYVHWFAEQGLYDGLFLMRDEETGSYWDHMTGEAVYGSSVGTTLEVSTLRQTTVDRILDNAPDAMVSLSDQALREDEDMQATGLLAGIRGRLNRMFSSTVKEEDDRRPTMDLGMGLWDEDGSRYYPYDIVNQEDRAVVDQFGGRTVLIYLDPKAFVLSALYVEGGSPTWDGDVLRLSDGSWVDGDVLYRADGTRAGRDRPRQVFTRWYGFSLTFPGTEIYGEGGS